MTCASVFTISDGTTTVTVTAGSLSDQFQIGEDIDRNGIAEFVAASGKAWLDVRYIAKIYTISGSGPADPKIKTLSLTAPSWTVTIPGFADGSAPETWVVVPSFPARTRDRLGGKHSWTLTLRAAAAS